MECTNSGCHWCASLGVCQAVPSCDGAVVAVPTQCPAQGVNVGLFVFFAIAALLFLGAAAYFVFICRRLRHPTRRTFIPTQASPYPLPPAETELAEQSALNERLVNASRET